MLEAVIFDKDGVLVNSVPVYYEATRRAFAEFGYSLTREKYVGHWTNQLATTEEFIRKNRLHMDPAAVGELKHEFIHKLAAQIKMMPFAEELLRSLQGRGFKKALVSSDNNARIYDQLEFFGLRIYFDTVFSGPKSIRGLPNPAAYGLACEEFLDVDPANAVVIEDSPMGAESARLAGCKVIFFPNGFTADMKYARADAVVHGLNEVTPE